MKFISWLKEMIHVPYEIRRAWQKILLHGDTFDILDDKYRTLQVQNEQLRQRITALEFRALPKEHQEVIILPASEFRTLCMMAQTIQEMPPAIPEIIPSFNKLDIRN
jgi:UDP-2,3-diacylglucosamine pyrophosphatase LpxH